jgi:hypothetical protein
MEPEYFRVRMPRIRGENIPMGAIYYMGPSFTREVVPIVMFWERNYRAGRGIVWSQDYSRGGPPYWSAAVDASRVWKLLGKIEALGAFASPVRNWSILRFDGPMFVIAIAAGQRRLFMQSADRLPFPRPGGRIENELDVPFCPLWCELDRALMHLRPDTGELLDEAEFQIDWLP